MSSKNISAGILAGGKALRMKGTNKAFIKIDGVSIIQKTTNILKEIFCEVLIVTNSPEDFVLYEKDCLIVKDVIKNVGPLGGIHSGLTHASGEAVFFVPCDMLYLHNEVIKQQIVHFNRVSCDALVPKVGNLIEPLHAIYRKKLKDTLHSFIKNSSNYSIKAFLETINVCFWNLEDSSFHRSIFSNINTPNDLKKIVDNESKIKNLA